MIKCSTGNYNKLVRTTNQHDTSLPQQHHNKLALPNQVNTVQLSLKMARQAVQKQDRKTGLLFMHYNHYATF